MEMTRTAVRTVKCDFAEEEEEKEVLGPKFKNKRNRMGLCRHEVEPRFAHTNIGVTGGASGPVVIKPLLDVRTHLRVDNGITQVLPNETFQLCMCNFSKAPRCSPKNRVVTTESRSPLEITEAP